MFICWPGNRIWLILRESLIGGRYEVIMVGRCTGPCAGLHSKRGVCLYKLISQTKRVSRPTSCFGSKQSARESKKKKKKQGPHPPGKTRWDLVVRGSRTSPLINEPFAEMTHLTHPCCCLSCKFRAEYWKGEVAGFEIKKSKRQKKINKLVT